MGYDESQSLQLASMAARFQNIADTEISAGDAASFINSQLKAFKFTAKDTEHVLDAVNEVANNFAVGTNDLQSALTKTGAALSVTGNSFEQTIGLVTAGEEILVGQSGKVGRGLRSIGLNLAAAAKEADKFEGAHGKVNIALKDSEGNLRSTYDILKDLSEGTADGSVAWDKLNTAEQTSIGNALAGKTQFETFAAVLGNFKTAINATKTAMDSQGSSAKENEKYLDSIEGRTKAFQSAWEELSLHVVSSDFLKTIVEGATGLIKVLDKVTQTVGPAGFFGSLFGGMALYKKGIGALMGFLDKGGLKELPEIVEETSESAVKLVKNAGPIDAIFSKISSIGLKGLAGGLATIASNPLFQAGTVLALTYAIDKLNYALSFAGKADDIREIDSSIESMRSEMEALQAQGDSLTESDKARLQVLQAQLQVLELQKETAKQEAQARFEKEAKKSAGDGKAGDKGTNVDTYNNAVEGLRKVNSQLDEVQKKWENGEISQEKYSRKIKDISRQQEEYNKALARSSDEIIQEQQNLELVDYNSLSKDAKAYYDGIHTAYLQMQTDNSDVQAAIADVIQKVGSAEFDSWKLDVSSFKNAEDFIEAVKGKIEDPATLEVDVKEEGAEEVEKKRNELKKSIDSKVNVSEQGAAKVKKGIAAAAEDKNAKIKVSQSGADKAKKDIDDAAKPRTSFISVVKRLVGGIGLAGGKRKGETGGAAWLGDEAKPGGEPKPELVVRQDGSAFLAGTTGWEMHSISQGDTVYSHTDTKKLLGGKISYQFGAKELPRFAKGKKSKTSKATKVQQLRDKWDAEMDSLDYYKELNNWTPQYNLTKLQASYKKFQKQFKSLKSSMTTQQLRQYNLDVKALKDDIKEQAAEAATKSINNLIGATAYNGNTASALNKIASSQKSGYITAAEAKELRGEVYKQNLEYIKKQTEAGTKSYQDLLAAAKKYWNEVGKTSEEYYESLEQLRESAMNIISKNGEKREDQIGYAKQYISLQIDELERQKAITQSIEDEADARAELLKSQNQYVKVYREGKGWVYEQDAEAIKSAEKALKELQKTEESDPVQQQIDKYNEILDLFDRYAVEADFIALQNKLGISGISDIIDGSILDKEYMSKWLQDQNTWLNTYDAWVTKLNNLTAKEYEKYASGVTSAMYNDVYKQYAYDISDIYSSDVLNAQQAYLNAGVYDGVKLNASQIASAGVSNFNFENLVLPNVTNAESFLNELQNLTSSAIQNAARR